jgi:murein DD-endopeptidase MepM/ murein hydrolase activator NlpD
MMGASAGGAPRPEAGAAADALGLPDTWPLPIAGQLLEAAAGSRTVGIEIAVPRGTAVRAAGDGLILEIRDDSLYGRVVRMRHRQGYESVYGNLLDVKVARGQRIASGAVIAASGDRTGLFPAHLHFEIIRDGAQVNPATIVTKGPQHGDLQ